MRSRAAAVLAGSLALAGLAVVGPVASSDAPRAAASADAGGAGAGGADPGPPPFDRARPLRIMVVGDSISHGQTGSASWRYWLWRESLRQGRDIRLVGPDTRPHRGETYEHLDHGFAEQSAHAAIAGSGYARHLPRVTGLVERYDPDVVLTELGFNDLSVRDPSSARHTAQQALRYTRRVLSASPDVRLVLAQIPGTTRRKGGNQGFARQKTALAERTDRRIDAALARLGSPRVTRADLRTDRWRPWRPARFTYDGVHPNSVGETLLAHHFVAALHEIGALPEKPRVFRREPWQPRPVSTSASHRRGATLLWWRKDAQRIYADRYVAWVKVDGRVRVFRPRPDGAIAVRLPRGTYVVRMVARRGTMVSKPGPRRWVRVRGAGAGG